MALPEQVSEFDFGKGLEQHSDAWLQASGFTRLENCVQDKAGALVKVPGYSAFPAASVNRIESGVPVTSLPGSAKLISRGEQVGAVGNGYVFSKQSSTWILQGRCSPWVAELRTVVDLAPQRDVFFPDPANGFDHAWHDCCRSGDWTFSCFEYWAATDAVENSRVCVVVTDLTTGATVASFITPAQSYGINRPRLVAWDTTGAAILVYRKEQNPAVGYAELCYRKVTPTSLGAENTFAGFTCDKAYDIASDASAAVAWVTYHLADSFSLVYQFVDLLRFTIGSTTLTQTHAIIQGTSGGVPRSIGIAAAHSQGRVTVAYAQSKDVGGGLFNEEVRAFARNTTTPTTVVWADQSLYTRAATYDASTDTLMFRSAKVGVTDVAALGSYVLWYDPNPVQSIGGEFVASIAPTTRGIQITPAGSLYGLQLCGRVAPVSKPFFDGTRVAFLAQHVAADATDPNHYYVLLGCEPGSGAAVHTRFRPLGQFGVTGACSWGPFAQNTDVGLTLLAAPYQDDSSAWTVQALERDPGTLRLRLRAYRLVSDDRVGSSVQIGASAYFAGALLSAWDGLRCLEAAWLASPAIQTAFAFANVTSDLDVGDHYWRLTLARTTAGGELVRSAASPAVKVTVIADREVVLNIVPYCLTNRCDADHLDMFVEIWRTKAGQASPFYLLARLPLNPEKRDALAFTDTKSDAVLASFFEQSLPYDDTPGAELPNDAPPPALHLCHWRNRLWLTDGEQIAYSKEGLPSRGAEFSLVQTIPRGIQQQLTALAPLGDVLIAFSEDRTAYVYGDAPAANGVGSTLTGPIELQTDVGCTQPAGLCATDNGVLVPTRQGIQLLSLKREYSYIGAAIETALLTRPRVRSADWQKGADRVWLVLSSELGVSARFVVWDMLHGTWSVMLDGFNPVSVRSVADGHYWTGASGVTQELAAGSWRVGTTEYKQLIETVWFKTGGALAEIRFKRAWLLAEKHGASGLTIECGFDFEIAYTHVATFTEAELEALDDVGDNVLILRIPAPRQRCHAVRFRITETLAAGADSEGFRFVAMRLLTALRGAKGPLKAARNAGSGFT